MDGEQQPAISLLIVRHNRIQILKPLVLLSDSDALVINNPLTSRNGLGQEKLNKAAAYLQDIHFVLSLQTQYDDSIKFFWGIDAHIVG